MKAPFRDIGNALAESIDLFNKVFSLKSKGSRIRALICLAGGIFISLAISAFMLFLAVTCGFSVPFYLTLAVVGITALAVAPLAIWLGSVALGVFTHWCINHQDNFGNKITNYISNKIDSNYKKIAKNLGKRISGIAKEEDEVLEVLTDAVDGKDFAKFALAMPAVITTTAVAYTARFFKNAVTVADRMLEGKTDMEKLGKTLFNFE